MLRIQKKYKFNYHWTARSSPKLVFGRTISFTSYPASIHSQDDFYQISLHDHHPGVTKITVTGTAVNLNFRRNLNITDQVRLKWFGDCERVINKDTSKLGVKI